MMSYLPKPPSNFFYKQLITSPYSNVAYYDPHYEPWKEWFAWYPVKKQYWVEGQIAKHTEYKWVWLKKINRRKVIDQVDGPGREAGYGKTYWEYATLMDMLANGH